MQLEEDVIKLFIVRRELIKLIEKNKPQLIQNIRENQGPDIRVNNAEIADILFKIFYK